MNPGARLLVIEDELPMRTALNDVLTGEGYRVLSALLTRRDVMSTIWTMRL